MPKLHFLLQNMGSHIYCHLMDNQAPREYATLPRGPDENFSFTIKNDVCTHGTVKYHKIGLDITVGFTLYLIDSHIHFLLAIKNCV